MSKRINATLGQELHEAHVRRIIRAQEKHSAWVRANKIIYPDPKLVLPHQFLSTLPDHFAFPSDRDNLFRGERNDYFNRRDRRKKRQPTGGGKNGGGKSGGGKGGKGGSNKFPNPQLVHQVVAKMLSGVPFATQESTLRGFETNIENANLSKINFFADSYIEIGNRCHFWLIEECDGPAARKLAQICGMEVQSSDENSRGQAVHILWKDARLEKLDTKKIDLGVQNIPDLRPAVLVKFRDRVTKKEFWVAVLHLKSMRGGPKITSVVRHKQFQLLVAGLDEDFSGIIGGDMNFPLNNAQYQEAQPMYDAGFELVAPGDSQATQIIGSRIDGWFVKNLPFDAEMYRVFAYFLQIGRALTDHASLSLDLIDPAHADEVKVAASEDAGSLDTAALIGGSHLPVVTVVPVLRRPTRQRVRRRTRA